MIVGVSTLVASNRPPSPTSTTATSTAARLKISNATAVDTSKNVGVTVSRPSAFRRSATSSTWAVTDAKVSESIGWPLMATRSSTRSRCGEV